MTDEEFAETYLNLKIPQSVEQLVQKESINLNDNPIDWRQRGAVTQVYDQGQCSSSEIFSSLGSVEGFYKITTGELPRLSVQQIYDCSRRIPGGCSGSLPTDSMKYIKTNGVTTDDEYPYIFNRVVKKKGGPYKINGVIQIAKNEVAFINALETGPLSVAVYASNWKYYKPTVDDYIFPYSECLGGDVNHPVLAVGYTNESIIIKNSWSTKWGLEGYIYLEKGVNTCKVWEYVRQPF